MIKSSTIYLTGSSGFVGTHIHCYLSKKQFDVQAISRINVNSIESTFFKLSDSIVHLAGKAHDLKNTNNPEEYYQVNTELTKRVFDAFLYSDAKVFITLSSVKAVTDDVIGELTEDNIPNPVTHYGKSKLLAEQYILSKELPQGKRVYILRPCMIHGPNNKGNLNLLYKFVSIGLVWPLGAFNNLRSFVSVDNLCFIVKELIEREEIPSGVYNVADDKNISTNELIHLISITLSKTAKIWNIPPKCIKFFAKIGDYINFPFNTERLHKLTETYIVSNKKIVSALGKPLPIEAKEGLIKTFKSFNKLNK
jgi:nucleoside-diphosphate-sugar epimerase